ncbi:hypothetical protein GF380_06305 [Candidatus Uhrbacteria bacterium]|nr:hypothetical protein [Candidatus Uhrbacteria bacterium]MBD3284570.1 hypothetical protein [Candidatus Uhrbacteria bacterium]
MDNQAHAYVIEASAVIDLQYRIPCIEEWGKSFIICGDVIDAETFKTQKFYSFLREHEDHPVCAQDPKIPGPKKIHVVRPLKPCMLETFMRMLHEDGLRFAVIEEWTEVVFQWLVIRRNELCSFDEIHNMELLCYGSYQEHIQHGYHKNHPGFLVRNFPYYARLRTFMDSEQPCIYSNKRRNDQVSPSAHYLCIRQSRR